MSNRTEQMGRLMGESLVRGFERDRKRKMDLLLLEFQLLDLELNLFLAGGPIPGENE